MPQIRVPGTVGPCPPCSRHVCYACHWRANGLTACSCQAPVCADRDYHTVSGLRPGVIR